MINLKKDSERAQKSRFRAMPLLVFSVCLGIPVGFGLGQVGHDFQVNRANRESNSQGKGTEAAGPCKAWADTICERMGNELAYECTHARTASALLSESACMQAQASVLAKIEAIKAERGQCNELTNKLCADLGLDGKGCELARAKEPTFSIEDCQDMTKRYPRVLAQIVERQEKGTLPSPPRGSRTEIEISKPN